MALPLCFRSDVSDQQHLPSFMTQTPGGVLCSLLPSALCEESLKAWPVPAKPGFPDISRILPVCNPTYTTSESHQEWAKLVGDTAPLQRLTQAIKASLHHGFTHTGSVSLPCPEPSHRGRRGQRVLAPPLWFLVAISHSTSQWLTYSE